MKVANKELLPNERKNEGVMVIIQNIVFLLNVHVLVLAICNMVLSIQWLRELGAVL